jgi:hypothetical protein
MVAAVMISSPGPSSAFVSVAVVVMRSGPDRANGGIRQRSWLCCGSRLRLSKKKCSYGQKKNTQDAFHGNPPEQVTPRQHIESQRSGKVAPNLQEYILALG